MTDLRKKMLQDMRIRNLSPHTLKCYVEHVARFAKHFKKSPDLLAPEHIRGYQVYLLEERKASTSVLIQAVCALRFLYRITLGRDLIIDFIPYPKKPKRFPVILSRGQVALLFEVVRNLKHQTILKTIYSAGLRVSEAVGLRLEDINSQRMVIVVRQGKGQKDRLVPLSPSALLEQLRIYWLKYRPKGWLFPGQNPDRPLSRDAVGQVVEAARRAAHLQKGVSPHTLRHCFATHQLEAGVDIRIIQILLGHTILRSTQWYTHVASKTVLSTRSPLDLLPTIPPTQQ